MNTKKHTLTEMTEQAIYSAIDDDANIFFTETKEGRTLVMGCHADAQRHVWKIDKFVKEISSSVELAFEVQHGTEKAVKVLELGKYLKDVKHFVGTYNPNYLYSEYAEVLYQSVVELDMRCDIYYQLDTRVTFKKIYSISSFDAKVVISPFTFKWDTNVTVVEKFNQLIIVVRKKLKSEAFKSKLRKRAEYAQSNFKSFSKYVDRLFGMYPKLMVVRVDLAYKTSDHDDSGIQTNRETLKQVRADREKFVKSFRFNEIFKNKLVGYIWKLEFGPEKGFHYHWIFFFDGSKVRKDVHYGYRIGEYWSKYITQGRGYSYNCNEHKGLYRNLAIGQIGRKDLRMRENLRVVVKYLTKKEQYLMVKDVKGRVLGRGEIPKIKLKRGRPRRNSNPALNSLAA